MLLSFIGGWLGFALFGRRIMKWSSIVSVGGGFIFGLLFMMVVSTIQPDKTGRKPAEPVKQMSAEEQRAASRLKRIQSLFSAWDGSHAGLTKLIKESMNNPDSYKHVKTEFNDMGDYLLVKTTFRGTNAFGGVVTNWVMAKIGLNGQVLEIVGQSE
jgi:hypothetical protein